MLIRSRAPLRIGLAGGGTDVSPYTDLYGGAILNATINMYAYATVEPTTDNKIVFHTYDRNEHAEYDSVEQLEIDDNFALFKGIYNRLVRDYIHHPLSFKLSTYVDAPAGSGLGTSSTLVVAIIGALSEWLRIPLGEYDIAHLAYEIERKDLDMAGGRQDQYAATFGGFNFMEFYADDKVIVNPLRIRPEYLDELQFNFLLYYTGTSRLSHKIIEMQRHNVVEKKDKSIEAMHQLKQQAILMKEALLRGQLHKMGEILHYGWQSKKNLAEGVSNPMIEELYEAAIKAGSTGGKISGAGGGGYMFFYCPKDARFKVIEALRPFGGEFSLFNFTENGLRVWRAE
jgi:D-glycero-alpha-D-manno-heptose-7-phosphate kinase